MLAEAELCSRCGEPHRLRSSFCSRCGLRRGGSLSDSLFAPTLPNPFGSVQEADRSWSVIRSVGVFFFLLICTSIVAGFAQRLHPTPWNIVLNELAMALVVLCAAVLNWNILADLFKPPRCDRKTAGELLLGVLVVTVCLHLYFTGLGHFVKVMSVAADMTHAHWPVRYIYLLICVIPAVVEEIACRGILLGKLEQVVSQRDAVLIQAALFSTLHLLPLVFVSHFVMGVGLGILRVKTKSLYPGMVAHGLWNAFVLSLELY